MIYPINWPNNWTIDFRERKQSKWLIEAYLSNEFIVYRKPFLFYLFSIQFHQFWHQTINHNSSTVFPRLICSFDIISEQFRIILIPFSSHFLSFEQVENHPETFDDFASENGFFIADNPCHGFSRSSSIFRHWNLCPR